MIEAIPIAVTDPLPQMVTIVKPDDEPDGPTRDSPSIPARIITPDGAKREQQPKIRPGRGGGHTRKVGDSFTGYEGHHHGRSYDRLPERSELDWDIVAEMDLDPGVEVDDEVQDDTAREDDSINYDTTPL